MIVFGLDFMDRISKLNLQPLLECRAACFAPDLCEWERFNDGVLE